MIFYIINQWLDTTNLTILFIYLLFRSEDVDMISKTYKVSLEKVKSLGMEFTPIETSLRDTVLSLKEKCLM